jgi:anti-sigma regulatory factor (Ser/Thr protein kinase)
LKDIVSGLQAKGNSLSSFEGPAEPHCRSTMLLSLVDSVIREKQMEYQGLTRVKIEFDVPPALTETFVNVDASLAKRILSNLINNAVEATEEGTISVDTRKVAAGVALSVTDSGRGIPEAILPQLAQKGFSFGKKKGSGLGLYHAKRIVESWGGSFQIRSVVGKGTQVELILPPSEPPCWHVAQLKLSPDNLVVSLDDDANIHNVWREKLGAFGKESKIQFEAFSNPEELKSWFRSLSLAEREKVVFLVDHEFSGHWQNGFDLVAALGIAPQSILVSGRSEDPILLTKCAELNLRFLPKLAVPALPIQV